MEKGAEDKAEIIQFREMKMNVEQTRMMEEALINQNIVGERRRKQRSDGEK